MSEKPTPTVIVRKVNTFTEACLAGLFDAIPVQFDYPYRVFEVLRVQDRHVFLRGIAPKRGTAYLPIKVDYKGVEYVEIAQRSWWERAAGLPPTVFRLVPFGTK